MSSFDDAFKSLIGSDGGYSLDPADPGGEPMCGVTARVAPAYGYTGTMKDLPLCGGQVILDTRKADFHNELASYSIGGKLLAAERRR